jgi:Domain of unknown function (DUF5710)
MRVYLAVPYEEKDAAKAVGARWDLESRRWYVKEGADLTPFGRWLSEPVVPPGVTIPLAVMMLSVLCYRCRRETTCVVGLRLPEGFEDAISGTIHDVAYISVQDCGAVLTSLLDSSIRSNHAIGPLEYRRTRPCPDGYLANTCVHCGATQGSFPLREEVLDFVSGDPDRIADLWADGLEVDYPEALLRAWRP